MGGDVERSEAMAAGMQAADILRQVEAGAGGGRGGYRQWVGAGCRCPWLVASTQWASPVGSGQHASALRRRAASVRGSARLWQLVIAGRGRQRCQQLGRHQCRTASAVGTAGSMLVEDHVREGDAGDW